MKLNLIIIILFINSRKVKTDFFYLRLLWTFPFCFYHIFIFFSFLHTLVLFAYLVLIYFSHIFEDFLFFNDQLKLFCMFYAISWNKFLFVKLYLDEMISWHSWWSDVVGKIVYNANPASAAENTKYNRLFSTLFASAMFLHIQLYCDRRTRNFAKVTVL